MSRYLCVISFVGNRRTAQPKITHADGSLGVIQIDSFDIISSRVWPRLVSDELFEPEVIKHIVNSSSTNSWLIIYMKVKIISYYNMMWNDWYIFPIDKELWKPVYRETALNTLILTLLRRMVQSVCSKWTHVSVFSNSPILTEPRRTQGTIQSPHSSLPQETCPDSYSFGTRLLLTGHSHFRAVFKCQHTEILRNNRYGFLS